MPLSVCVVPLQKFWELVCSLLLHKHSWIRLASGRLLGMFYDACGENNRGYSKSKASFEGAVDSYVMFESGSNKYLRYMFKHMGCCYIVSWFLMCVHLIDAC